VKRSIRFVLFAGLALATLAGSPIAQADTLTVFAAASLKNALDDIATEWKKGNGPVVASYASSSVLAKQIEQGAPADVFISADTQWMDYVDKRSLIEMPRDLLGNKLVLISGKDNPLTLEIEPGIKLGELLGDGRLALGDPSSVPAGIYAKEALTKLKIWNGVQSKLAPAADVRGALVLVSRGEAPLGIVYETDAKVDPRVRIVATFPEDSHKPIRYPVAVVKASKNADAAKFVAFLSEPAARAIFIKYGFEVLDRK
jgi:molybdate transport system substrate-binding protein